MEEVKRIKQELKDRIKAIAMRLAKAIGRYNGYDYVFEKDNIAIKCNSAIKYVRVDGDHVISQYDKEYGILKLYKAYELLKEMEEEYCKEIDKIKGVIN